MTKLTLKQLLLSLICLATTTSHAEDYEALVERALNALDNDFSEHWSYTETREQGEEISSPILTRAGRKTSVGRWSLSME